MLRRRSVEGMVDRIEHLETAPGVVGSAQLGQGDDEPRGCVGILSAVFPDARRVALDIARFFSVLAKGGVNNLMISSLSSTSRFIADCIAVSERAGSPCPESTLQDWAMESIWHSSDSREPSGEPSS